MLIVKTQKLKNVVTSNIKDVNNQLSILKFDV